MMTKTKVAPPTPMTVTAACERFDSENQTIEQALGELFGLFPSNTNLSRVLLKVVALNRLYSTQILAVIDVAVHIQQNAQNIDSAMAAGSPDIVDDIAKVTIQAKVHNFFSFATKYCSWHNPKAYPIYDSRVDRYIWSLQKQNRFTDSFNSNADLWNYPKFFEVMTAFRNYYGLRSFTFKEIDKFIWSYEEIVPD